MYYSFDELKSKYPHLSDDQLKDIEGLMSRVNEVFADIMNDYGKTISL